MKEIKPYLVLLLFFLAGQVIAAAQDTAVAQGAATEDQDSASPGFEEDLPISLPVQLEGSQTDLRLEVVIHRWSDRGAQDDEGQKFSVSVVEQPVFIQNVRWEDGPELEFAPGEHSKTVTLVFDTSADGSSAENEEEAKLVLRIDARHEAVIPDKRDLEIPLHFTRALQPGESQVSVCALRSDAPEEFPIEEAFQYCDPDRVPVFRSDRIVLFFTPARDLREPIGEDQYFLWRIVGPNGNIITSGGFWNKGNVDSAELTMKFTTDGSPGRFAVPLQLWDSRDDPDPTKARKGPGTYTVRTVDAKVDGTAVFGQGEATLERDGEWRDEGTFDIAGVKLAFAGFVAEEVTNLPLPAGMYPGTMTVEKPQVSGSSATLQMNARWRKSPEDPEEKTSSRLSLTFAPELTPDYKAVGNFEAKLEIVEAPDDRYAPMFRAGLHRMVTTNKPPDRYLVDNAIPTLREPLDYRGLWDCTGGQWLWRQQPGQKVYWQAPQQGKCAIDLELTAGYLDALFGSPERGLADHLHDPQALWVIPVFYALLGNSSLYKMNLYSYGYALYAAAPYTGPAPSGRPDDGEGEDGVGSGEDAENGGSDEGDSESDSGSGDSDEEPAPDAPGSSGPDTGSGSATGPASVPIDTSNPGGLDPDRQPQVANLVREWLSVAEPPENAVPGVHFRYDEFGRMIGGGGETGRTVSQHDSVDYGTGASPEAKVWSALRTKLDSIDHCTLEEYVITRLEEASIEYCRGRYGAVRDLRGVPLAEARSEVSGKGFQVTLVPGAQARTPEEEGTVERQDPRADQHLKRGESVTLAIHSAYVPALAVIPDLVGLPLNEARQLLNSQDLVAVLQAGTPAMNASQSGTVESQWPVAQTQVEAGTNVRLSVHSEYVAGMDVPNVVGLTPSEARAALAAAGVDPGLAVLVPGNPAPSREWSGRVENQEPTGGTRVAEGTRITLRIHPEYVELRTVPNVVGQTQTDAEQSLRMAGLRVLAVRGSAAQAQADAGRVESQAPSGGAGVEAGTEIQLRVFGPYVAATGTRDRTGTGSGAAGGSGSSSGGLPSIDCPQTVTFVRSSCLADHWRASAPAPGTQVPLDRSASEYFRGAGGVVVLECAYRIGNAGASENAVVLNWRDDQSTGWDPSPDYCKPDQQQMSWMKIYSQNRKVNATAVAGCFDINQTTAVARGLISQAESYAQPCQDSSSGTGGIVQPRPDPEPTPPACPGPTAPHIYNLWNPPPYGGLGGLICQDAGGKMWVNISNNVYPVNNIIQGPQDPRNGCWLGSKVVTPRHTYEGNLCRK